MAERGTLLLFRIMEDAGTRGFHEFDLLRGDESVQASFAGGRRPLLTVRSSWGLGGTTAAMTAGAVRRAHSMAASAKGHIARGGTGTAGCPLNPSPSGALEVATGRRRACSRMSPRERRTERRGSRRARW